LDISGRRGLCPHHRRHHPRHHHRRPSEGDLQALLMMNRTTRGQPRRSPAVAARHRAARRSRTDQVMSARGAQTKIRARARTQDIAALMARMMMMTSMRTFWAMMMTMTTSIMTTATMGTIKERRNPRRRADHQRQQRPRAISRQNHRLR
jgi:hypothetical protein